MTLTATTLTQTRPLSAIVQRELQDVPALTREKLTVLAGDGADRALAIGTVYGKRLFGTPTSDATGNTGNGTIGSIALGPRARVGDYVIACVVAATDGGIFQVTGPDGVSLGLALVGTAFANDALGFTIADGATDFVVGDTFTLTVPAGDGKAVAVDFAATDGSQVAAGVLGRAVTAPDAIDVTSFGINGYAQLVASELVWPAGATAGQKTQALADLAARNLIAVEAA